MVRVTLSLLGGFQARLEPGGTLSLPTRKAQALLAYLALPAGRTHPRDKLAALLWGGIRDESARASLRQALFSIRKALGEAESAVVQDGDGLALDARAIDVDAAAFERAARDAIPEAWERAGALYRGELLDGLILDEAPFEEWVLGERERLRELALEALARLLTHQRKMGATEAAIQTALRLLALDPLQEPVHRTLMRLYAESNRRGSALRQYQQCVHALQRELGIEPEAETKALYQDILRQRPVRAVPDAPGLASPPGAAAGVATSLIGRTPEIEWLRSELESLGAGAGRVVALLGEAGIGKTRLAAELVAEAAARGMTVLLGRSYESEQILPFGPWVDAMRAGGVATDTQLLASLPATLRPELARLLPEVGETPLAGATDARLVFESVTHLVAQLAARRPVVLVLEDLHWADEMSARLLAFAGRRLAGRAVGLVVTARDEEIADAPGLRPALDDLEREGRLTTVELGPLSRSETLALVRAVARISDGQALERLAARAWTASEGNAFVAVETVRADADNAGVLEGSGLALPERVRAIISRRLDRLSESAQALAAVATIIGREFDFTLLQRAAGRGGEESAAAVEELVRRGVLHGLGERFDFTHDRIREVVYHRLLVPRRKLLHLRVAEALEAARGEGADVEPLALGLHYREAEVWAKAIAFLEEAGKRADQRGAYRESAACFERVLDALRHQPENRQRAERIYAVSSRLRGALVPLGDLTRQVETIEEMESIANALGDRRRLAQVLANAVYTFGAIGDHHRALDAAGRGRALAEELGDLGPMILADSMAARAYYALGELRSAIEAAGRAVAAMPGEKTYREIHRTGALQSVSARVWLGMALAEQGDFAGAHFHTDAAIRIADADEGAHEHVWSRFGAGRVAFVQGDVEGAVTRLERILATAARGDLGGYVSRIASTLGSAHLLAGRTSEALALLEQAAAHGESIKFMHGHSLVLALLAEGYLVAGRRDDARRTADDAIALGRKLGEHGWEAWAWRVLALLAATAEPVDLAGAEGHFAAARALAEPRGMRPLLAHCRLGLAEAHRRAGNGSRAAAERAAALAEYEGMGMMFWAARARV